MRKAMLYAVVVAGLSSATFLGVSGSSAYAGGGCPTGWWLDNAVIYPGDQGAVAMPDKNGDGKVCFKGPDNYFQHANSDDPGLGAQWNWSVVKDNVGP